MDRTDHLPLGAISRSSFRADPADGAGLRSREALWLAAQIVRPLRAVGWAARVRS